MTLGFGELAALSALGAVAGFGVNSAAASATNRKSYKYTLGLQQQAQSWQEKMSNTAHQRQVADMEAAGLNPRLSAMNGSGASTGSVGAGSVTAQQPQLPDLMSIMTNAAQFDFTRSQAENMRQDSILKGTQVLTERQKIDNMLQDLYESRSREGLNRSQIREIDGKISLMKKQQDALDSTIQLNFVNQNQALANTQLLEAQTRLTDQKTRWVTPENIGKGIAAGAGLYIAGRSKLFGKAASNIKNVDTSGSIIKYLGY